MVVLETSVFQYNFSQFSTPWLMIQYSAIRIMLVQKLFLVFVTAENDKSGAFAQAALKY